MAKNQFFELGKNLKLPKIGFLSMGWGCENGFFSARGHKLFLAQGPEHKHFFQHEGRRPEG